MTVFIYSHGGYAREFARNVRAAYPESDLVFIDDAATAPAVTYAQALAIKGDRACQLLVGFSQAALRRNKTEIALRDGFTIGSVTAETAIIGDNVVIGAGAIVSDFAMLTADIRIGVGFQCNIYSYIAHDCVIGDYVTLAPRVSVNGRVEIADDVYIGTGATILPGTAQAPITIGKGATIGAHSLVTKDVPAGATMIGVPARQMGVK